MTNPVSLWIESGDGIALDVAPALLGGATGAGKRDARYLGGLAATLTVRYQRGHDPVHGAHPSRVPADPLARRPRRDPTDLDGAVEAARGALAAMSAGDPDRSWVATTLAVALALRYEQSGDLVELGEALALAHETAGIPHPSVAAARGTLLAWAARTYATRRADAHPRDLRGRDLSGRDLRDVDLGGADLTGARLVGADLTGASLAGATLIGARLDRALLVGAVLSGADLTDAWLTGADLTETHLTAARLDRTVLAKASMDIGALAGIRCRRALVLPDACLESPGCQHPSAAATVIAATSDLVATGHEDTAIRLWDATTGMLLRECPDTWEWDWSPVSGFESSAGDKSTWAEVAALAFSPDGGRLAGFSRRAGPGQGETWYGADLLVWDLGDRWDRPAWDDEPQDFGSLTYELPRPAELAFSPNSRWLALGAHHPPGANDGRPDHDLDVCNADHRYADEYLRSAEDLRWSLATDTDEWHRCLAYSPDSRLIAAGCVDAVLSEFSVSVRHTESGAPVGRWSTGSEAVLAIAFAVRDQVRAITCGRQRWSTWQWGPDTNDDGELWHCEGTLTAAAYSPDGLHVAVATSDHVALCDAVTGAEIWSLATEAILGPRARSASTQTVTELRFAPDGRWLVAGTAQTVRVHDAATGTALPGTARAVAFVPDGYWAIHADGSVHLHDATGTAVRDLNPHRASMTGWQVAGLRLLRPDDLDQGPARPPGGHLS